MPPQPVPTPPGFTLLGMLLATVAARAYVWSRARRLGLAP